MKLYLLSLIMLVAQTGFGQPQEEKHLLSLSSKVFEWEVKNNTDSLANVFDEQFIVVSADGGSQRKAGYLQRLKSGDFVHNSIDVEESAAIISGNTAVVTGKGAFAVTVSGNKVSLHLSYVEVFTREGAKKPWKVFAMKASVLAK